MDGSTRQKVSLLVLVTCAAALRIDASKAPTGSWDRAAFLSGFQNAPEIPAHQVRCAELPSDLVGTYYRNGPARFIGYDGKKVRHPLDADGLVTGVTLDGRSGTAVVRQRYVATAGAIAEYAAQRTLYPGHFGNPRALWDGGMRFKNRANTNCLWHGGKLLALWEASRPHVLDPLSLATQGEWDVDGLVGSCPMDNFAAHPRLGSDGGVANFAYAGNPAAGTTTVRFWDFQPGSYDLRSPAQKHEVPGFGLFHDFLVTENYFVLVASPATWGPVGRPTRALQMTLEFVTGKRPFGSMICFDESQPTTVHLYPRNERSGLRPKAIELDTFFSFHHANAWEEGDTLVFDTVSTPKINRWIRDDSSLEGRARGHKGDADRNFFEDVDFERDAPRTDLVRYTLDLKSRSYARRALSTRHLEYPSVAPSVSGLRHRFVYTTAGSNAEGVTPVASVLKTDTEDASKSQIWLARPFEYCGEVSFTPRAGSTAEDDGYLLTICYNGRAGTSALLVLDARRVADGPIARVPLSLAEEEGGEPLPSDAIAGPGHGVHATFVPGLAPTLHEVQEAEEHRGRLGSRFLSDA